MHGLHRSLTGFQEVDVGFTGVSLASALRFSRTMDPSRSGGRLNRELGLGQVHSDRTHANLIERACLHRSAVRGVGPSTSDTNHGRRRACHLWWSPLPAGATISSAANFDVSTGKYRKTKSTTGPWSVAMRRRVADRIQFSIPENRSAWRTLRPGERLPPRRPRCGRNRRRGSRSSVRPRRSRLLRSIHPSRRCSTHAPGKTPPQRRSRAVVRTGGYASTKFSMTPVAAAFENQ